MRASVLSMAAPDEAYVSKIECRYFRVGRCNKGEQCHYSHSLDPDRLSIPSVSPISLESSHHLPIEEGKSNQHADCLLLEHGNSAVMQKAPEDKPVTLQPDVWVKACEFTPGKPWKGLELAGQIQHQLSYNESSGYAVGGASTSTDNLVYQLDSEGSSNLYVSSDNNAYDDQQATVIRTDFCDMCGQELPPACDEEHRNLHIQECIRHHEEEMELSFAIQRSQDKVCGVCMEVIWEKEPESSARFGILSNCFHVFCLSCIRRWRAAQQFDKKTVRGCPECRVQSDFVVPSRYWYDSPENKSKLIETYKAELGKIHCRHFARGCGQCPFNEKCFYLHAYPDGRIASPRPVRRRGGGCPRRHEPVLVLDSDETDSDSDVDGIVEIQPANLYDIIEELNERVARLADQLENSILRRLNRPRTGLLYMNESDHEN